MIISISGKIGSGKDTVGKIIQLLTSSSHFNNQAVEEFISRDFPNPKFEIKKFADKLKDIVCLLLGCTRTQLEDREFKEKELGEEWWYYKTRGLNQNWKLTSYLDNDILPEDLSIYKSRYLVKTTPRLLLQLLGTECGRDILHPNIWCNSLIGEYKTCSPPKGNIFDYSHTSCVSCKKPFSGYKRQFICNDCHDSYDWYPKWIITDTRFPNELDAVKSKRGITIKVVRQYSKEDLCKGSSPYIRDEELLAKLAQRYKTMKDLPVASSPHPSETALDDAEFDYEIINDGTIDNLIDKVREILIKEKIM